MLPHDAGSERTNVSHTEYLLQSLLHEVRDKFAVSESNQVKIQGFCDGLNAKIINLTERLGVMESSICALQADVELNTHVIQMLKRSEKDLREKLESLENHCRRINLRFLNIPEGAEGDNIKDFIISLIKDHTLMVTSLDLALEIQRVHRDPFKRNPNKEKPRKVLANFASYRVEELILAEALKVQGFWHEG
ncbi:hypothetical protein NDU88_002841 [Pleurodeles waltl]|uniref:Uncharacterized protein n=1 Tax=Pleurodeles waltl TaxID=8319 RepID=A0AAV7RGI2_PLEWA|nr:hypothetical protein NDU88_002841 [Pleurodeles waltl]